MLAIEHEVPTWVHCRIGSSEIARTAQAWEVKVHCRIGSSENTGCKFVAWPVVHCRIGSSEIALRSPASP